MLPEGAPSPAMPRPGTAPPRILIRRRDPATVPPSHQAVLYLGSKTAGSSEHPAEFAAPQTILWYAVLRRRPWNVTPSEGADADGDHPPAGRTFVPRGRGAVAEGVIRDGRGSSLTGPRRVGTTRLARYLVPVLAAGGLVAAGAQAPAAAAAPPTLNLKVL